MVEWRDTWLYILAIYIALTVSQLIFTYPSLKWSHQLIAFSKTSTQYSSFSLISRTGFSSIGMCNNSELYMIIHLEKMLNHHKKK